VVVSPIDLCRDFASGAYAVSAGLAFVLGGFFLSEFPGIRDLLEHYLLNPWAAIGGPLTPFFRPRTLPLELVFQEGRVMSPAEAKYPEDWRNVPIDEQIFVLFLDQPTAITALLIRIRQSLRGTSLICSGSV
jgi:hypothetical protein